MHTSGDVVATVEAVYHLGGDEQTWLERVCEAADVWYGLGLGTIAWTFTFHPTPALGTPAVFRGDASYIDLPARYLATLGAESSHAAYTAGPTTTGAAAFGEGVFASLAPTGIHDFLATLGFSPAGLGVMLGAPANKVIRLKPGLRFRSERMAAHLAAAHRLRLQIDAGIRLDPDHTDAVLAPDGAVIHATGEATESDLQEKLREAARRVDRARGRQRREAPEEALDAWRGLVDGRWSLLDHFESDGRRFILAVRNPANVTDPRALTQREAQVACYAALGYSGKQSAYTLGIDPSAVSRHLAAAVRKLGLNHPSELPAFFAQLVLAAHPDASL